MDFGNRGVEPNGLFHVLPFFIFVGKLLDVIFDFIYNSGHSLFQSKAVNGAALCSYVELYIFEAIFSHQGEHGVVLTLGAV